MLAISNVTFNFHIVCILEFTLKFKTFSYMIINFVSITYNLLCCLLIYLHNDESK